MEKEPPSGDGVGMTLARSTTVALWVCLLTACGTDPIQMSGDPATLPPFKSFRIDEEQFVFATEISEEQRAEVSRKLREAAVSALEKRGYQEATDADVLVALAAVSRPLLPEESGSGGSGLHHVDTSVLDAGRPFTPAASEIPPAGVGREGDLMMSLRDAKTKRALWQASSNGAATTPGEALRKARSTYAAMAAKLPKASSAHE
jgi:Domain of unknown function (DUF4136)